MMSSIKETCQESTEKLKEQKDKVLKSSTEGMEIVTHWLEDKMTKRIYEFREGSKNDENILGQKGISPYLNTSQFTRRFTLRTLEVRWRICYLKIEICQDGD